MTLFEQTVRNMLTPEHLGDERLLYDALPADHWGRRAPVFVRVLSRGEALRRGATLVGGWLCDAWSGLPPTDMARRHARGEAL